MGYELGPLAKKVNNKLETYVVTYHLLGRDCVADQSQQGGQASALSNPHPNLDANVAAADAPRTVALRLVLTPVSPTPSHPCRGRC